MATKGATENVIDQPVDTTSESLGKDIETTRSAPGKEDVAAVFANYFDGHDSYSEEEAKRLRWKLDVRLIPILWFNILLPAMDKVSHAKAAVYGLQEDLHLVGDQYSWIGSIFYFGYMLWCFPSATILQKLPLAKTIGLAMLLWSFVLVGMGFVNSFSQLLACRFLLGLLEAPVVPGNMLIMAMWYTRAEQTLRYGLMYTGLSTIFTGLIGWAIGFIRTDKFYIWQSFFWICGVMTFVYALFVLWLLPDSPVKAKFINERQKAIAIDRVRANQTGIENRKFKREQLVEAFMDVRVWLMVLFNLWISIPNGGLTNFSALIIKGLGYSGQVASLLTIPNGISQTISSYACNWGVFFLLRKNPKLQVRGASIIFGCIPGLIGTVLLYMLPTDAYIGRLVSMWVGYFYLGPYIVALSLIGANTSGHTKKVTVNAMMFVSYCVSNIIGPMFFKSGQAPLYPLGIAAILVSYGLAIITIGTYMFVCHKENMRRDALDSAAGEQVHLDTDFKDKTDKENLAVRSTSGMSGELFGTVGDGWEVGINGGASNLAAAYKEGSTWSSERNSHNFSRKLL